jgi:hypothetical protein
MTATVLLIVSHAPAARAHCSKSFFHWLYATESLRSSLGAEWSELKLISNSWIFARRAVVEGVDNDIGFGLDEEDEEDEEEEVAVEDASVAAAAVGLVSSAPSNSAVSALTELIVCLMYVCIYMYIYIYR